MIATRGSPDRSSSIRMLADGKIDAGERKFLQRLAVNFNIRARVASQVVEAMLVKNHL